MPRSIVGRDAELATIGETLAEPGRGLQVLLIEGEPGIGKSILWQDGIDRARRDGSRVLSCRTAQAEARMSFAALGDLLADVEPDAMDAVPPPQRLAIDRALLRVEAGLRPPAPQAIGAGVLALLSALTDRSPVVIGIDDVQWLDAPTARCLAFALRRLETRPVAVLATERGGHEIGWSVFFDRVAPERVRRLPVGPLSLGALFEVLSPRLGRTLTRPLLGSIESASRGNPFYALELARAIADEDPRGGRLPVLADTAELVARRLRRLPRETREELLKASALAQPRVEVVDADRLRPAVAAEIARIRDDGRVEFTHPLFAAAVYAAAAPIDRQRVHRDLAAVSSDAEEQARHLALASAGPDRKLADLLDRASVQAFARGSPEVAADLVEQAARRTPDATPGVIWDRLLRAGQYGLLAGNPARVRALGQELTDAAPDGPARARALYLRAQERGVEDPAAAIELLEAAIGFAGDDAELGAEIETHLGWALIETFQLAAADAHLVRAVALAARAGDRSLLAQATALRVVASLRSGRGVDDAAIERSLELEDADQDVPFLRLPTVIVANVLESVGRLDQARELLAVSHEWRVSRGDEAGLAYVLAHQATVAVLSGDLEIGERFADDAVRVAALAGQELIGLVALSVRAIAKAARGDPTGSRADGQEALARSERAGWPPGFAASRYALGFLALTEADPTAAAAWLDPVVTQVESIGVFEYPFAMSIPDAIEVLVETGDLVRATRLTDALEGLGRANDRPWALALAGRSRALIAAGSGDLDRGLAAAQDALAEHERLPMPLELGRTLLVLGRLQRRRGERRAARETLGGAEAIFERIGARPWADKARAESRRIGVRRAPSELTANEHLVVRLAVDGLTNVEIAAQMFVSRRTVEANLSRAYAKLGVRSRAELVRRMSRGDGAES